MGEAPSPAHPTTTLILRCLRQRVSKEGSRDRRGFWSPPSRLRFAPHLWMRGRVGSGVVSGGNVS